jgi:two-component system, OmpR family, KDP operon response regulator KdpE
MGRATTTTTTSGSQRGPVQQPWRVLVIEDDPSIREMIEMMLVKAGYDVVAAEDAVAGLRLAYQTHPHAIILDVMMPEMDGFEACRRLREMTDAPILFLTGKATTADDAAKGLDLGADEYMTKPFKYVELLSRLRVILRRADTISGAGHKYLSPTPSVLLDCARRELTIGDRHIYLRPKEFEVLEVLMHFAGRVLTTDAILHHVWGPERVGDPNLVKQYIYQLRQKIEVDPQEPHYLQSIPGGGYYFSTSDPT